MRKSLKTFEIDKCRICEYGKFDEIGSLGTLAISNFTAKPSLNARKAPLELILCKRCSLLQLRHNAPQEIMYARHYWYRSALNRVIADDLKEIAHLFPEKKVTWIDIGANDGTLLRYVPKRFDRVGVEPAENLCKELGKYADDHLHEFWEDIEIEQADVITAIGMMYDSEEPNKFVANVKTHLKEDGVFVAQMMTLHPMMKLNDVANICHEHLLYPNYKALVTLFERNGLEIFKVEENDINGGSYRLFARHLKKGSIKYKEPKYGLKEYKEFFQRIEYNKKKTWEFINQVSNGSGKKVYGYAASSKGNTLLQYYKLDNKMIQGIAEKNPEKIGKYTVETSIPIVSENEARKKADYFFILSWAFTNEFIKREKKWHKAGGKFLISIPNFRII